jgi:pimeloyl-ACP methyl ester carboxylesterase
MQTIKEAASASLATKWAAITGVSRSRTSGHGSNAVHRRLRDRGHEVFAVNPNADEVEGDRSYKDLRSIPGDVAARVRAASRRARTSHHAGRTRRAWRSVLRRNPMTGSPTSDGWDCLYHEEQGEGVPILLIHPAGATASTWGAATEQLARIGRVIAYDRRGYARSGGEPVRMLSTHTADAAALLEHLGTAPAVVVGTSAGAAIAVDLAVRRPDLVRVVVAHEFPWRFTRQLPTASQVVALATIGALALRGRHRDAAEALLRSAYTYSDGGSAWDAFPEQWRQAGRENARAALADFRNSIREYPSAADLATIETLVVCTYGERSPSWMFTLTRRLAATIPTGRTQQIEGSGHAAPFDATANFVQLIADNITSEAGVPHGPPPSPVS